MTVITETKTQHKWIFLTPTYLTVQHSTNSSGNGDDDDDDSYYDKLNLDNTFVQ